LKAGTTFTAGTQHWVTDRRRPSSGKPPHDFPISNYPRKPGSFTVMSVRLLGDYSLFKSERPVRRLPCLRVAIQTAPRSIFVDRSTHAKIGIRLRGDNTPGTCVSRLSRYSTI
jgi:hypothetical protein